MGAETPRPKKLRKLSVKIFSALYRHAPLFISETVYRIISKLAHIRE